MEIVESGMYRLRAVAKTERDRGGLLKLYVDSRTLGFDSQKSGFGSVDLDVSPAPEQLWAGQHVTATLDGEPIPPENLTVERLDP